jgi:hypothetical protein
VYIGEAYSYNSLAFKVLSYMTLIYRVFQLEYLMGRNNSPGVDILELEDNVFSGRNYWNKTKDISESS